MIRQANLEDLDFFYFLYMHPQINPFLLYEPMSKGEFVPIFDSLLAQKALFVYSEANETVGMFKLIPLSFRTAHIVYLGGVAVHPDYMRKGAGTRMLQEIIAYIHKLGFKRIELSVAVHNHKAIKLYEKVGFEKEGVLKKYTYLKTQNQYIDEQMMAYWIGS